MSALQGYATKEYQIVITLFLYFGSRAFHKSYGFFGPRDGLKKCTHTPEW